MADDAKEKEVLSPVEWLIAVLSDVVSEHNPRFAGLGLVLYTPPMDLPVTPLIPAALAINLPCRELAESIELLRRLSDTQSPLHDGFHLVDANTMAITHVCHFFAPSIPGNLPQSIPNYAVGARFMAALLGSLLQSVVMTAIVGEREGAIAIERGIIRPLNIRSVGALNRNHVAR